MRRRWHWLESSGVDVQQRLPIHVTPPRRMWPARMLIRACHRLPALARFGVTAIWWHGRKRTGS